MAEILVIQPPIIELNAVDKVKDGNESVSENSVPQVDIKEMIKIVAKFTDNDYRKEILNSSGYSIIDLDD